MRAGRRQCIDQIVIKLSCCLIEKSKFDSHNDWFMKLRVRIEDGKAYSRCRVSNLAGEPEGPCRGGAASCHVDQPTLGLLLCKDNNRLVAEYSLSGMTRPMGVANYQLRRELPPGLPSVAEIEAELASGTAGLDMPL